MTHSSPRSQDESSSSTVVRREGSWQSNPLRLRKLTNQTVSRLRGRRIAQNEKPSSPLGGFLFLAIGTGAHDHSTVCSEFFSRTRSTAFSTSCRKQSVDRARPACCAGCG